MKHIFLGVLVALGLTAAAVIVPASQNYALGTPGTHPINCSNPYTSSSPSAEKGYTGANGNNYVVSADIWNDENITQTIESCAQNSWQVTVSASGTAVQSYPDSNITFGPDPAISSYKALTSNFRDGPLPTGPGLDYESAYDVWTAPANKPEWSDSKDTTETMLWTHTDGQVPAGSVTGQTKIDGQQFKVWYGGQLGSGSGDIVTFEAVGSWPSTDANLLPFFSYEASHGYLSQGTGDALEQIGYGYEVCSAPAGTVLSVEAFNVRESS